MFDSRPVPYYTINTRDIYFRKRHAISTEVVSEKNREYKQIAAAGVEKKATDRVAGSNFPPK